MEPKSETGGSVTDAYTDGAYLAQHPNWHSERAPFKASQVLEGLKSAGINPSTVCDIGCGTGLVLSLVAKDLELKSAVGFEPSPDAPLHPDAKDHIEFRREEAGASKTAFDVALMLDVFEHVEDCYGFLRDNRRLARHFVFHIPLDAHVRNVVGNALIAPRKSLGHLHYFTRMTALATLRDTGYKVLHWHFTKNSIFEGRGWKSWLSPVYLCRRLAYLFTPEYTHRVFGGLSLLVVAESRDSDNNQDDRSF